MMRHLVFVLMIALLPLRGWLGDAMATQMAVHAATQAVAAVAEAGADQVAATDTANGHHSVAGAATDMPPDCMSHSMQTSEEPADHSGSSCANCSVCQACHTVAMTVSGPAASEVVRVAVPLNIDAAQFASAEPVTGQKPPIS